jgi:hypothetical protein
VAAGGVIVKANPSDWLADERVRASVDNVGALSTRCSGLPAFVHAILVVSVTRWFQAATLKTWRPGESRGYDMGLEHGPALP